MTSGTASVADSLRRALDRMTPNERRAAHRLLADYPLAGLDTTARFGEAAGVSAPTVLRMVAKLGFPSYGAFQDALKAELAARAAPPLTKGLAGAAAGDDLLAAFTAAAAANLAETMANLPRAEFAAAAHLLADPRRPLHLLGGRFTDPLAEYMAAHLRVLRPQVRRMTGQPEAWRDRLLDVGRRDVLLIFDIRRYSRDLLALAERAAERGASIVLMTDQWLSPISKVAKHVLPAHVVVPSVWDSSAALMAVAEALVAAVVAERGEAARDRLAALERLRGEA
ncbi:MurR/RpiR family transcriptional regulator [Prosthecomicrobium pneumaticum]|uniref:DNA-binding MurR/RpiR family transcriptional regulator n=1 Tax=Prosthecomicrobium pneumaticum TaxID=81895 RepID=A0A7W9FLB5_9HYPH|nr:MurR/RpiR family transcriptional regulator [Prosthecomicrobium pneumaticum]MBB5752778.1 DNA-binding MurR/RpiR family transcriptional regulator [Prosthecomicrobium pneumaticum]